MTDSRWRLVCAAAVWTGVLACHSSETTSTTGSGGEGGAWTVDNYCARFAERWCEAVEPRCVQEEIRFDPAGCAARYIAHACEPLVALVRDGRVTFQLEAFSQDAADASVEECIASWRDHFANAYPLYGPGDLMTLHNRICNAFGGTRRQGDSCFVQAECEKTFAKDRYVMCVDDEGRQATVEGRCNYWRSPTDGEDCTLHEVCGAYPDRLYCQQTNPASCTADALWCGKCVTALAPGDMCTGEAEDACGMDGYCDHDATYSLCKTALKGAGEPCASQPGFNLTLAPECKSRRCAFGQCTHPLEWYEGLYLTEVFLGAEVCNGGGG